ncbi:hypothetical protein BGC07_13390 [Piscirickettsia litoralis]|uniref:Uncharacterized protein n=1 Tax=Piscirickettsia litoralis TaxID=1891921 RepID=A0ABX3A5C0_9GAMM|nr:hypothetical protein BGC07_13390 [Piscirickettsia litoralis]
MNDLNLLTQHFSYLAITSLYLQNHIVAKRGNVDVRGSIVLNPDTYGMGSKNGYYQTAKPPVHKALTDMLSYLQSHSLITADQKAGYESAINNLFPDDADTSFKTYNQAINWIVHAFGPNVTYGPADNIWAGDTTGHTWVHTAVSDAKTIQTHVNAEAKYLLDNGVFSDAAPYKGLNPTFIAFDKYERNTFVKGNHVLANYFYSANDWSTYMQYVSGVSQYISNHVGDNKALPIMLFQTPGGHIPSTSEINWQYGSTAVDYILGDDSVCKQADVGVNNIAKMLNESLDSVYGSDNTGKYSTYLQYLYAPIQHQTYYTVHNGNCIMGGHMAELIQDHVFSVLWGGGSTTSISGPEDDGGYLSNKIKSYMSQPYDLQGNVIPQPYS